MSPVPVFDENARPFDGDVRGLYAITPDEADTAVLLAKVAKALAGGVRFLQYRNKTADAGLRREQAASLREICHKRGARLIINDHLDLALEVDADGLHLGGDDGSVALARTALGPHKILGSSCYNAAQRAAAAEDGGADYVAFGSFFPSTVKPAAVRAPVELLRQAKRHLQVDVIAIGGITLANAPELIAAGADGIAVLSALFDAPDIGATARRFSLLFGSQS